MTDYMSNRTYLEGVDDKLIVPGRRDNYDATSSVTIAETAFTVPFIWLALFREDDLVEENILIDGASTNVFAPIAERSKALLQLQAAFEPLRQAFPDVPQICGYVDLMLKELDQFQHKYFTVDLFEIEDLAGPSDFRKRVRHCLRGFSNSGAKEMFCDRSFLRMLLFFSRERYFSWRETLIEMSGLNLRRPIPSADALLQGKNYSEGELFNFYRLMPGAADRKSVWQK
jgi:hypothetical protein